MPANQRLCFNCNLPMKRALVRYKHLELEARECPQCQERIFTEDLALKAAAQLEAQRLESEYIKHPIRIGHSWGITFPREIVKVFGFDRPKALVRLHPDVGKGKIEISLQYRQLR